MLKVSGSLTSCMVTTTSHVSPESTSILHQTHHLFCSSATEAKYQHSSKKCHLRRKRKQTKKKCTAFCTMLRSFLGEVGHYCICFAAHNIYHSGDPPLTRCPSTMHHSSVGTRVGLLTTEATRDQAQSNSPPPTAHRAAQCGLRHEALRSRQQQTNKQTFE